jgi:hypothetical protein
VRRRYHPASRRWRVTDPPFTLDSLQVLYNDLVDSVYGDPEFHPDSFKVASTDQALAVVTVDLVDPSELDTNYYYFERFDSNDKVDDTAMAYQVDSLGQDAIGIIRKVHPYAKNGDVAYRDDGTAYNAFYEYEYVIDGLQLAEPVFLAVTAFDFGNPAADLSPLESSPMANAVEIWPIQSAEVVKRERDRIKPGVYPNPYRLGDDYNAAGWENPRGLTPDPERARKVTFNNLPDTCTITIWSLDGDLVRKLEHAQHPSNSQASVEVWNLITRNTQAVKTGIYIYTVESRFGTDIGKLVIIK